jgi:pimeloyl-ACP methyl ester carboxylesterase
MLITADGARFSYVERGAGRALMLLHGIGSGSRSWQAQLDALSSDYRVIAWDAPGYEESAPFPVEVPDAGDYAGRLLKLLAALRVDRLHLVGHSLGAVTAARFAADHHERIASLTLASPSGGHARLPEEERAKLRNGRLTDIEQLGPRGMAEKRGPRLLTEGAKPEHVRAVVETMARVTPVGYAQAVRMLSTADTRADLARLPKDVPVQFIYGEADVITPPPSILEIAKERPGAPVTVIPKAGHAVYIEQPDAFNRALRDFARA